MKKEKPDLEKKVMEGIYGKKELKKEEKNIYLGEFKERVIRYLNCEQVKEQGIYPEILEAVKHPEADKVIIDRNINLKAANDYIKLAIENNLKHKRVHSPELKGDVGLVVVSNNAVSIKNRKVLSREERLKALGISDKLIKNVGAKLCDDCWNLLKEKAPSELINYKKMNWYDKITGTKCICQK
ncbi:MAG: DUF1694 domain-containing protein [Halothermotrichaceae bacterium]